MLETPLTKIQMFAPLIVVPLATSHTQCHWSLLIKLACCEPNILVLPNDSTTVTVVALSTISKPYTQKSKSSNEKNGTLNAIIT